MFEFKEELTTDNILNKISDYTIFKYYCPSFTEIGRHFNSELRKDPTPSAIISKYNGKLWYKDFGETGKAVDCFGYVMKRFSINFLQALGVINVDFNLGLKDAIQPINTEYLGFSEKNSIILEKTPDVSSEDKKFELQYRNWLEVDDRYWKNRYYLDIKRRQFFDIHPIKSFIIDNKPIPLSFPSYSYEIRENDKIFYKIYSPFSKKYKWISNCKSHHYFGYSQLPEKGDKLIISKSLKDIAVLSLFGLVAVSPQSENQIITFDKYKELKERFNQLYIFYDNDRAGIEGAKQTRECYPDITALFIPDNSYGIKDISDYINKYRYSKTNKLIQTLL